VLLNTLAVEPCSREETDSGSATFVNQKLLEVPNDVAALDRIPEKNVSVANFVSRGRTSILEECVHWVFFFAIDVDFSEDVHIWAWLPIATWANILESVQNFIVASWFLHVELIRRERQKLNSWVSCHQRVEIFVLLGVTAESSDIDDEEDLAAVLGQIVAFTGEGLDFVAVDVRFNFVASSEPVLSVIAHGAKRAHTQGTENNQ